MHRGQYSERRLRQDGEPDEDGKPFSYHANQPNILNKLLTVQLREAMRKPSVPALVVANPYDDIVGYPQMAAGAKTWCAKEGAKIRICALHCEE